MCETLNSSAALPFYGLITSLCCHTLYEALMMDQKAIPYSFYTDKAFNQMAKGYCSITINKTEKRKNFCMCICFQYSCAEAEQKSKPDILWQIEEPFKKSSRSTSLSYFILVWGSSWRLESSSAHYFAVIPFTSVSHHILICLGFFLCCLFFYVKQSRSEVVVWEFLRC